MLVIPSASGDLVQRAGGCLVSGECCIHVEPTNVLRDLAGAGGAVSLFQPDANPNSDGHADPGSNGYANPGPDCHTLADRGDPAARFGVWSTRSP